MYSRSVKELVKEKSGSLVVLMQSFESPPLFAFEMDTCHEYSLGLKEYELLGWLLEL